MGEDDIELLPAIADAIRGWFPELEGRAVAVTDAKITKENLPTLPLAMVAPLRQVYTHNSGGRMGVDDGFIVAFWLKSVREVGVNGETPFWSYYNFNAFRNKLFDLFAGWRTPQNGAVRFVSFDVDSDDYAVMLSFRMRATYDVCVSEAVPQGACEPTVHTDGQPGWIRAKLCKPLPLNCDGFKPEPEVDPCARE